MKPILNTITVDGPFAIGDKVVALKNGSDRPWDYRKGDKGTVVDFIPGEGCIIRVEVGDKFYRGSPRNSWKLLGGM